MSDGMFLLQSSSSSWSVSLGREADKASRKDPGPRRSVQPSDTQRQTGEKAAKRHQQKK